MIFSSLTFLILFFPLFLLAYFISPSKIRNLVLVIFSCIFFAWGEPVYIYILLISSIIDFLAGISISRTQDKVRKKMFLLISLFVNISLLSYFKYFDFFISTYNNIFNQSEALKNVALPLGISFFTFQTMSYTIDVYRGKIDVQKNFIKFLTYVTMFPQLVAGPIVRYSDIVGEIDNRKTNFNELVNGFYIFLIGLLMKVFLANQVSVIADGIFDIEDIAGISMTTAWIGVVAYAFQIYYDFAGYSTMAIGIGRMIGFTFPDNFNYPYSATSITDFWRRWHISLGRWFRDYVYIPLGGNKVGRKRWFFNIFVVWFLTGMWHGASWNYIIWGLYFGVLLVVEKRYLLKYLEDRSRFFTWCYSIFFILLGWVIFRNENLNRMVIYFKRLFSFENVLQVNTVVGVQEFAIILLLCVVFGFEKSTSQIRKKITSGSQLIYGCLLIVTTILCFSILMDGNPNPFIYFRF